MKTTIYIPDDKAEIFEEAKEKLADSISATFVRCLERELENRKLQTDRIIVEVRNWETGRIAKKAFEGTWLIGDENQGENHYFDKEKTGFSGGAMYSIARTKRGRIVVVTFNADENPEFFTVYDNFDTFRISEDQKPCGWPESLISAVAAELDIDHVEEMDI